MKKIKLLLAALCISAVSYAQAPQAMNYQGIARDVQGHALENKTINMRISVIDGAENGKIVYTETHDVTTNKFGLYTLKIGEGKAIEGLFDKIDWKLHNKFVKVETIENGSYQDLGTTQLLSVPYALYAESAGKIAEGTTVGGVKGTRSGGVTTTSGYTAGTDFGYLTKFAASGAANEIEKSNLKVVSNSLIMDGPLNSGNHHLIREGGLNRGYYGSFTGSFASPPFGTADNDMDMGTSGTNPTGKLHMTTQTVPRLTILPASGNGRVGINNTVPNIGALPAGITLYPNLILDINGRAQIRGGAPAANYILTSSDANGYATWKDASTIPGIASAANDWHLIGNTGTTPGTNFIGTLDAKDVVIKTNATEKMRVTSTGEVGIGNPPPAALLAELHVESTNSVTPITAILGNGKNNGIKGTANVSTVSTFTKRSLSGGYSEGIGVLGVGTAAYPSAASLNIGTAGTATTANRYNVGVAGEASSALADNIGVLGSGYGTTNTGVTAGLYGEVITPSSLGVNSAVFGIAPDLTSTTNNSFAGNFQGKVKITDGSQANNYILTSGPTGIATWKDPSTLPGVATTANEWHLTGNTGTTPGTNYIGTADAQALVVKTNATEQMRVTSAGNVGIGTTTPTARLDVVSNAATGVFTSTSPASVVNVVKAEYTGTNVVNDNVAILAKSQVNPASTHGIGLVARGGYRGIESYAVNTATTGTATSVYADAWNNNNAIGVYSAATDNGTPGGVKDAVEAVAINGVVNYGVNAAGLSIADPTSTSYGVRGANTHWNGTTYDLTAGRGYGIYGEGKQTGVYGESSIADVPQTNVGLNASFSEAIGVHGKSKLTGGTTTQFSVGTAGSALNVNTYNFGAINEAANATTSNFGAYNIGDGIALDNYGTISAAYSGTNNTGVSAEASGTTGSTNYGVYAFGGGSGPTGRDYGVYARGDQTGVYGFATTAEVPQTNRATLGSFTEAIGVLGEGAAYSATDENIGVAGISNSASNSNIGTYGEANNGASVNWGVLGHVNGTTNLNIAVGGAISIIPTTGFNVGIYGAAPVATNSWAGYFDGKVNINDELTALIQTAATKSFKIDHPLEPKNKILRHSVVESPDMMNIYNGNITTDANGKAIITMPSYFEALNQEFRYQLTVIDQTQFAQARVSSKIAANTFEIMTDKPNIEISWQVTGIRHDAVADKFRIKVEEDKVGTEVGKYLWPQAFEDGKAQIEAQKKLLNTTPKKSNISTTKQQETVKPVSPFANRAKANPATVAAAQTKQAADEKAKTKLVTDMMSNMNKSEKK
jgi:hypothetical protein